MKIFYKLLALFILVSAIPLLIDVMVSRHAVFNEIQRQAREEAADGP